VLFIQGGIYYAVPSSVPGVQQLVYSVPVDSTAGLMHGISDQLTAVIQVCTIVYIDTNKHVNNAFHSFLILAKNRQVN